MVKKVIAIIGTYRKGKVIDTAVSEALRAAESLGANTEKIYLIDKKIEFCTNCRLCTQLPGTQRGNCVHNDEMQEILDKIETADAVIFAAPINVGTTTAVMKRFVERLAVYRYWPWGKIAAPKWRIKELNKKALTITSSTAPAWMGRILMPASLHILEEAAKCLGARVVESLYFGCSAATPDTTLSERKKQKAFSAGLKLLK